MCSFNVYIIHTCTCRCGVPVHSITVQSVDISTKCWLNLAQAISVSCDNPQNGQ